MKLASGLIGWPNKLFRAWAYFVLGIGALLPVVAVNDYWFGGGAQTNHILHIILFAAFAALMADTFRRIDLHTDRRLLICAAIGGGLLAVTLVLGRSLYQTDTLSTLLNAEENGGFFLLDILGLAILFSVVLFRVFSFAARRTWPVGTKSPWFFGDSRRSLFLLWGALFLIWLPCYLAYYPGVYSYDALGQTLQALGASSYDRFQTTAHTFFMMLCFKFGMLFGDATAGLVAYALIQMLIMSFVFAMVVWLMAKMGVHLALRGMVALTFAFNPMNALFSFIPTKDVLFAAFFLLITVMLADAVRRPAVFFGSLWRQIVFGVILVLACLFRNNAVYALALFAPFFVYVFRKHVKRALLVMGSFLLCFVLMYGPVYTLLGVEGSDPKEALSVPLLQVGAVASRHEYELTDEDWERITEIIPYEVAINNYNPRYADPIKDHFDTAAFLEQPGRYAALWFSLFTRYPGEFVDAFLNLNLGYWYPDCEHPDAYTHRVYIESNMREFDYFPVERSPILPALQPSYEYFAQGGAAQDIPIVAQISSIGFPVWFLIMALLFCIGRRHRRVGLIFLPGLLIWLTYMAGPVSNVRYIYCLFATLPVYLAICLQSGHFQGEKHEKPA